MIISQSDPLFVIVNDVINDDLVKLVTSSHAFVLAHSPKKIMSYPEIVQVAQFMVKGKSLSLVRKVSNARTSYSSVTISVAEL